MHIGIAGTGKMGAAMAVRLQSLGHQVTVWNRTRQRAQSLLDAGIGWADTPQALADATEVVISIVVVTEIPYAAAKLPDSRNWITVKMTSTNSSQFTIGI